MKRFISFLIALTLLLMNAGVKDAETVEKIDFHLTENEVAISFLDFSSGEATLIQSGDGKNILINTGGPSTKKELKKHLKMYEVDKIDLLIITNRGPEYTANMAWLLKHGMVGKIAASSGALEELTKERSVMGVEMEQWEQGDLKEILPGLIVKVLYEFKDTPEKDVKEVEADESQEGKGEDGDEAGDNRDAKGALILSLIFGKNRMLYMGATDPTIERELVEQEPLKSEIIKVPEFANRGSEQFFIEAVDPEVAVIFNGKDRPPKQSIIERLQESWIDIYTTGRFGNVSLKCDPENYELITVPVKDHQEKG